MFVIGEAVIDDAVAEASFCCDLGVCKGGCCCIDGGRGAPLEDDEVLEIKKAYPMVRQYLGERSIRAIESSGMYEGTPGDFTTACIDEKECVFVSFDDGIAKCSFERAFVDGRIDWRKPISCHLFPLRIRSSGQDFVRYERIDECAGGQKRGELHQVKLADFLRDALIRKYGERWYAKFRASCEKQ